jgi:hypothetical protein
VYSPLSLKASGAGWLLGMVQLSSGRPQCSERALVMRMEKPENGWKFVEVKVFIADYGFPESNFLFPLNTLKLYHRI